MWYTVQRTRPEPLTGSEVYVHDLESGIARYQETKVLATYRCVFRSSCYQPPNRRNVLTFRESPSWLLTGPLSDVLRKDESGKLMEFYAGLKDGFFHSTAWGYYSSAMRRYLHKGDFDIIHSAAVTTAAVWLGWEASLWNKKPFVVTPFMHSGIRDYYFPYVISMLTSASAVIVMTEYERQLIENLGVDASKIHIIPIGIEPEKYTLSDGSDFRTSHNIGLDDFVILLPRKLEVKGFFHSLDAILKIASPSHKITLVLLDKTPVELKRRIEAYKALLTQKGVKIIDTGYLVGPDLISALKSSDVVVEPSRVDSLGIVYLESWACRKPVIAANFGATSEVIKDGTNGILVDYGGVDQLADSILRIMDDERLKRLLGENGFRTLLKKYTYEQMITKTNNLYRSMQTVPL